MTIYGRGVWKRTGCCPTLTKISHISFNSAMVSRYEADSEISRVGKSGNGAACQSGLGSQRSRKSFRKIPLLVPLQTY